MRDSDSGRALERRHPRRPAGALRRYVALVALGMVVVLATPVGATGESGAQSDGPLAGVPSTPTLDAAIETLEPTARSLGGETLAGLWLEETETGAVTSISVAFTQDAAGKVATLARDFPEPALLRPVAASRSIGELEALQAQMIADREQVRSGSLVLSGVRDAAYDLDIDVKRNATVVTLTEASPQAILSLQGRYGRDVIVEEGEIAAPECTRTDCRYLLRSGLQTVQASGGWCSTAFTVRVTATGNRNILSAAHCGGASDGGTGRWHGGQRYGDVRSQQMSGRVDAERHGPPQGSFEMRPRTFVNSNNKWVPVERRSSWDGLVIGNVACKSGARTGKSCGAMTSKHYSPSYVPNSNRFVRAEYCAGGGDSGSGVYKNSNWSTVHGIHSGGGTGSCDDSNDWSIFGHIEYALNALNATLVTAN